MSLADRLSTAAFYGVPFAVLTRAREIAQQRQRVRLILQNNEGMEANAELILKLEATGYLPRFDYQTCQPVYAPREEEK